MYYAPFLPCQALSLAARHQFRRKYICHETQRNLNLNLCVIMHFRPENAPNCVCLLTTFHRTPRWI